ncbi:hypothetical protein KCH_64900 [Kitasatospora cheerisanensis KCTC 2395]|uniref:Uncharacterized protein n=1 Tax=Kitasatospora cheerisanensis KCTC 2395 TaxID=1348663 RepID=A0A066YV30_9ACTN|nr:hypothetical protein KCH_64900 [Kitasatospora cheerisanensis KCTC 2395]
MWRRARAGGGHPDGRAGGYADHGYPDGDSDSGSRTRKVQPSPGAVSGVRRPPCAVTRARAMARPGPEAAGAAAAGAVGPV